MRIDHHAYRKATRVAGFGFLLQTAIGVTLLVFGVLSADTIFRFAAFYVFGGLPVWLSLIVIFHQHTQERLEVLEEDELAAARGESTSVFQHAEHEKVAARRLRLMHQWLMPAVSILVAAYLGLGAAGMLRYLGGLEEIGAAGEFVLTGQLGWAVAVCLAFGAVSFIFSRFVAGMARQTAWQNLRGGAGYMVGNAIVMVAAAVGIVFRFFDPENDQVSFWIAYAIPFYMLALVVEIAIHFILNLYRPRIPGHVPRPAFDSRVLSLFAAPESIVRSLNEAVNYQFGFDITSSWGYQLLMRSFGWLLAFGVIVLVGLDTMVVVEPNQQAIRLRGGRIIGDVYDSGLMWKWPWPFETAEVTDVGRARVLPMMPESRMPVGKDVELWSEPIRSAVPLDPFIVAGTADAGTPFSLVDAQINLEYRVKPGGLMDYLNFSSDQRRRGRQLTMREAALRQVALRAVTDHLSGRSFSEVIARGRSELVDVLRDEIQAAFDDEDVRAGVDVLAVNIPRLRPAGDVAKYYEDYATARQQRRETVAKAEQTVARSVAYWIGDPDKLDEILSAIDWWLELRNTLGPSAREVVDQQIAIERLLAESGGELAREIARAEAERWIQIMNAQSEVHKHQGLLASYHAAPDLFMEREIMKVFSQQLANRRKYVLVGIDPQRVNLGVELPEASSLFTFEGVSSEGESGQ